MNLFTLAWRNLLRNRRRSLLTILAVVAGAMAILLFGGYVMAVLKGIEIATVREAGHVQVQRQGFLLFGSSNPSAYSIEDPDRIVALLRNDQILGPMTAVVTPRLQVQGVAGNFSRGVSRTAMGVGVVASDENALRVWDPYELHFAPAPLQLREDVPDGAVIGHGLAQFLHLCGPLALKDCHAPPALTASSIKASSDRSAPPLPDDLDQLTAGMGGTAGKTNDSADIELLAASAGGAPNVVRLRVLAVERHGMREKDDMSIAMPLALAQKLIYGADRAEATGIVVQLKDTAHIPYAKKRIAQILEEQRLPFEVHDFKVINPYYGQVVHLLGTIFGFVAALMGLISVFGIANAINMAISERISEIGTLRALGLRRGQIRGLFLVEGALLGVFGAAAGLALATVLTIVINYVQLTWTPPGHTDAISLWIDLFSEPRLILLTGAGLIVLACVSAWLPARRAANLEIVEALGHV